MLIATFNYSTTVGFWHYGYLWMVPEQAEGQLREWLGRPHFGSPWSSYHDGTGQWLWRAVGGRHLSESVLKETGIHMLVELIQEASNNQYATCSKPWTLGRTRPNLEGIKARLGLLPAFMSKKKARCLFFCSTCNPPPTRLQVIGLFLNHLTLAALTLQKWLNFTWMRKLRIGVVGVKLQLTKLPGGTSL